MQRPRSGSPVVRSRTSGRSASLRAASMRRAGRFQSGATRAASPTAPRCVVEQLRVRHVPSWGCLCVARSALELPSSSRRFFFDDCSCAMRRWDRRAAHAHASQGVSLGREGLMRLRPLPIICVRREAHTQNTDLRRALIRRLRSFACSARRRFFLSAFRCSAQKRASSEPRVRNSSGTRSGNSPW